MSGAALAAGGRREPVAALQPSSIAVFRASHVGDLLCCVPALRALRRHWPNARLTLIALPWARELAARFPLYIDDFLEFAGYPGLTPGRPEPRAAVQFLQEAQRRHFDLALQLNDSGEVSNPFVALLGAQRMAGYFREGQWCPDAASFLPWQDTEPEPERGLRLLTTLGIASCGAELEAPVSPADRHALQRLEPSGRLVPGTYVCLSTGARSPSRRWYPERFAVVADALARRGLTVVLTGTVNEAPLARRVIERMAAPAVDLVGKTALGTLAALIDGARLVVANDTGVRQLAAARGTPCVAIACGSAGARSGQAAAERVLLADVDCRPCTHARCPVGHTCAHGVESRAVIAAAEELLAATVIPPEPADCAA